MSDDSSRCPTPEEIAAFVAGSLEGAELMRLKEHLKSCDDCRLVLAEAARVDRESEEAEQEERSPEPVRPRKRIRPWWLAAAAAALAGLVVLRPWPTSVRQQPDVTKLLVEAVPHDARYVEPRLSGGFPWAPLATVRRGANDSLDPRQMKIIGAAGEVLEQAANDSSARGRHATAVAHLLAGRPAEAAALLEKLAASSPSASVWSDLSASHYAAAIERDRPTQLARALTAADAALRLDPKYPEALFNRALVVERLGLRAEAREAWTRYLAVDATSSWAAEARRHLHALAPIAEFRQLLDREYPRLLAHPTGARVLANGFPQEARLWGETEILGRWAEAWLDGDRTAAQAHLAIATAMGDELARGAGDRMLIDASNAIAKADQAAAAHLARAHVAFRQGQRDFRLGSLAGAGRQFEQAAAHFEKGKSPVVLLARYFSANTVYDRGGVAENRLRIQRLLESAPPQYAAHRAQVQWQMGLARAAEGEWGAALDALGDSIAIFERLRERRYAAIVREIFAEVYDRIGDRRSAWQHRVVALRELGKTDDTRLQVAVQAAARGAALDGDWQGSLSFLDLMLAMVTRGGDDLLELETLLFRARVYDQLSDPAQALADLNAATTTLARLHDPDTRARADADRAAVAGILTTSPVTAVAELTHAIDFHRTKGRRMFLPEMYLERGRAHLAAGDHERAAADFESGIREMENQRESIEEGDERWGVFGSSPQLFEEAVSLALARGENDRAFQYSERARAREVLDSMGASWASASSKLTAGANTVYIEYVSLPATLVIFVFDGDGVRAVQRPFARVALAQEAERLADSAVARDAAQFRRSASALYARLFAPVADELDDDRTVVVVPDATLSAVPFAALLDSDGRYVVERHAVVIAPSASVYARLQSRRQAATHGLRLLVISGPGRRAAELSSLSATWRESLAVAAAYGRDAIVARAAEGSRSFDLNASSADIIHFAGHADAPEDDAEGALVTSGEAEMFGTRFDVHRIAALRLPRARAVILAACATARGRNGSPTSVSVARAFIAAGAPSVVATLWPIEDDLSADFFPRLHQYLARGLAPAEALRATQIEWIRRPGAPPGMWAAVQVIGS